MARMPKPWWREDRQAWFVTIRGERHNLGPDKAAADREFHRLMSKRPEEPRQEKPSNSLSVADVFEKFLDWCEKNRAERTYLWYREYIQEFIDSLIKPAAMPASSIRPFHVVEWVDKHPTWGASYRRGAIIAIQRPFNWAAKIGYISESPIRYIEKPQPTRREQVVSEEEWQAIRDRYAVGDPFRELLEFAWETGCRPQEAKGIEARHVELDKHRVVFPPAEAKGKKRWRIIYLTPRAEEIIKTHLAVHDEGLLFLNSRGRKWTSYAMNCRFARLKAHLGIKYACYSLRHGFATRKLEAGLDHITVAALMGHADATMLARVYSHISERQDHLREQLNRDSANA
jgi:site-specific recombinase XerD